MTRSEHPSDDLRNLVPILVIYTHTEPHQAHSVVGAHHDNESDISQMP
jgi:hypothetical protein